ncbi:MAG: YeeE/YedE family protein [Treponemataceae bacterium]
MKKTTEYVLGFVLLALTLVLGISFLGKPILLARLIIGLGIGYVLVRSAYGFAGTANRAFDSGSTKLMRAFMLLIILSAFLTVVFVAVPAKDINSEFAVTYGLFIHPITIGTFLGALMFGIGMSFAGGCASGVLTDLSSVFPQALLGLIFFGVGRFLGAPLEKKVFNSLINTSLIKSSENVNGVWLPDFFKFDGLNGFLGAYIVTLILAGIVIKLSYNYESKRKAKKTYSPIESEEKAIEALADIEKENLLSYKKIFTRPWTLWEGSIGMAIMYAALMGFTRGAWGVSGPFGYWIGKFVSLFTGKEAVLDFVGNQNYLNATVFTNPVSLQDIGIILGGFIALLTMGKFFGNFKEGFKISGLQVILSIVGGLLMGFGTIFAKGCNAGGLFSPIVSFSLSGWLFLIFMVTGAFLGNKIIKSVSK